MGLASLGQEHRKLVQMELIYAGKQAEVLNILLDDVLQGHPISDRKLKEMLGHTPIQASHWQDMQMCRAELYKLRRAPLALDACGSDQQTPLLKGPATAQG